MKQNVTLGGLSALGFALRAIVTLSAVTLAMVPAAAPALADENSVNSAIVPAVCDSARFQNQCQRMAEGDIDLLMVGDSITEFWENAGREVWDEFYGHRKVLNFGISGERTEHILWRIDNAPMKSISPKMVVVMIGTNNVGHGTNTPEETLPGIVMIVDRFRALYPDAKILLLSVFPRGAAPWDPLRQAVNTINDGLNARYGDGQVDNVSYLDISSLFLTPEGFLPAELMPDFLHPRAAGYELWAAAMEPAIAKTLGDIPFDATEGGYAPDSWQLARHQEKCQMLETADPRLLLIGDSITHFWEEAGKPVWEQYYGDKRAVNLGISGDKTENVLWRVANAPLEKVHPKGICLLIGVNNISVGRRPVDAALGVRAIVEALRAKCPEAAIIVQKVFPWGAAEDRPQRQDRVDALNRMIPAMLLGIDGVRIVDLTGRFVNAEGNIIPEMMPDLTHPNRFGYEIWGSAMDQTVREMLAR